MVGLASEWPPNPESGPPSQAQEPELMTVPPRSTVERSVWEGAEMSAMTPRSDAKSMVPPPEVNLLRTSDMPFAERFTPADFIFAACDGDGDPTRR